MHLAKGFPIGALLALLILPALAFGGELLGRVVGIADGDTFTLLTAEKEEVRIRLAEVDAPESGQPFGNKSRNALARLIFDKDVRVAVQTTDRYGRIVGRPFVGDIDVCAEMVRGGAAWAYRRYLTDEDLLFIEAKARAEKQGIWGLSEAEKMPPWEWRRYGGQQAASVRENNDCQIKGNINSRGERIYHVPGAHSYAATKIDEARGERWFCDETEARAAGWRAPR
jgi:endonuclease YncB( thermonuclease family)